MRNIVSLSLTFLLALWVSGGADNGLVLQNPAKSMKSVGQEAPPPDPAIIVQGGDNIESAVIIPSLPFADTGTTVGYTNDYIGSCGTDNGAPDVVYSYAPAEDQYIDISLCNDSANFDTRLYVFENDEATEIACNDDGCEYAQSRLTSLWLAAGNTYYIVVDGHWGGAGRYEIYVTVGGPPPPPPPNDNCVDVVPDHLDGGVPLIWTGDTRGATNDCWMFFPAAEVWHAFTTDECMDVVIDACGNVSTELGIYELLMQECPCGNPVQAYGCDWEACGDGNWTLRFYSLAPGTYYFGVLASPLYAGLYEVHVNGVICSPPPSNDDCANAIPIGDETDLPFSTYHATPAFDPGVPNCLESNDVWYLYTAPFSGVVEVDLCGSRFDTRLAVYDGYSCDPLPTSILCAREGLCGDPYLGQQAEGTFIAVGGNQYLIQVGGDRGWPVPAMGDGDLSVRCTTPTIDISPTEVSGRAPVGHADSSVVTVTNVGTGDLVVTINTAEGSEVQTAHSGRSTGSRYLGARKSASLSPYPPEESEAVVSTPRARPLLPPDPTVILQGGDDINSAEVIPALPYTDAGTTIRYTNDYSGGCGLDEGAPDIVYSYVPVSDIEYIDISLCSPATDFDTRLYVFQDDPSVVIACNDNACSSTSSKLSGVMVTFGNTYYIVVDGSSTDNGNYEITVTPGNPPPANDNCQDVFPLYLTRYSPLVFSGDNTGATVDCERYPQVWAAFTTEVEMNVVINHCGSMQGNSAGRLYIGCPCERYILPADFNNTECLEESNWTFYYNSLAAGTYYYAIFAYPAGPYTVHISGSPTVECVLEQPPYAVPEGEPDCYDGYVDVTNGGCEAELHSFSAISPGMTIWGSSGTYVTDQMEYRDTDWYQFALPVRSVVRAKAVGEFPLVLALLKTAEANSCDDYLYIRDAVANECDTAIINMTLDEGTYWLEVAPSAWSGMRCGAKYVLNMESGWLSTSADSVTIAEGASAGITVYMNASQLSEGLYAGNVIFTSNDVGNPVVTVPVEFTVGPAGCPYIRGDVNGSGRFDGIDVGMAVNFFRGDSLPPAAVRCPPCEAIGLNMLYPEGDVNGTCKFDGIDISYMVNHFKYWQAPNWDFPTLSCLGCPPAGLAAPLSVPALKSKAAVESGEKRE